MMKLGLGLGISRLKGKTGAVSYIDPASLFKTNDQGLWMDAEQGLTDQSGNGNDLSGVNEPTQTQLGNGVWVMDFDGVDDGVGVAFTEFAQPYVLCLAYSSSTGANYAVTDGRQSNKRALQMNQAGGLLTLYAGAIDSISGGEVSNMSVTLTLFDGANSKFYKNGNDPLDETPEAVSLGTQALNGLEVGHDFQGNSHLPGQVQQVFLLKRDAANGEMTLQEMSDLMAAFKNSSKASY